MNIQGGWRGVLVLASVATSLLACSSTSQGTGTSRGSGTNSASVSGGRKVNSGECSGATGSGSECAGAICITLNDNPQGKKGICTSSCVSTQCGANETCERVDKFNDSLCFRTCTSNADCVDGFVCSGGVCFVETSSSSPAPAPTNGSGGSGGPTPPGG